MKKCNICKKDKDKIAFVVRKNNEETVVCMDCWLSQEQIGDGRDYIQMAFQDAKWRGGGKREEVTGLYIDLDSII